MNVQEWTDTPKVLRLAVLINAYRVVPRLIVVVYYTFFIKAWFFIVEWFIAFDWSVLPKDQIIGSVAAASIAGFPAIILGVLTKVLLQLTSSYWNGKSGAAYQPPPQRTAHYAAPTRPAPTQEGSDAI